MTEAPWTVVTDELHFRRFPEAVEVRMLRANEPEVHARVEVGSDGARLSDLRFTRTASGRAVRQSDLRHVDLDLLVDECAAVCAGSAEVPFARLLQRGRQRALTPNLLVRVADVYRANIAGAPTKAVELELQVSPRMATEYVSRARRHGYLPPTKQGKKQA